MRDLKPIDGARFGKIVALWHSHSSWRLGKFGERRHYYVCICDCGRIVTRLRKHLIYRAKSCGCSERNKFHGMSKTPKYRLWNGIRQRCLNPNYRDYHRYGGRGITLCDRWKIFENFAKDIGEIPKNRSLDRIDNNGGYSPENCRWATRTVQQRNRRNTRLVTIDSETKPLAEWCEIYKKNYSWAFQAIFRKGRNPLEVLRQNC